jgi:hypothetical protein
MKVYISIASFKLKKWLTVRKATIRFLDAEASKNTKYKVIAAPIIS